MKEQKYGNKLIILELQYALREILVVYWCITIHNIFETIKTYNQRWEIVTVEHNNIRGKYVPRYRSPLIHRKLLRDQLQYVCNG